VRSTEPEKRADYNPDSYRERIQRGGIKKLATLTVGSHRPARTFVQVSNGYISARTRVLFIRRLSNLQDD